MYTCRTSIESGLHSGLFEADVPYEAWAATSLTMGDDIIQICTSHHLDPGTQKFLSSLLSENTSLTGNMGEDVEDHAYHSIGHPSR